jgi:hypothetical protein
MRFVPPEDGLHRVLLKPGPYLEALTPSPQGGQNAFFLDWEKYRHR